MKLAKAEHVFITHKHWRNLGGLLGKMFINILNKIIHKNQICTIFRNS